MSENYLGETPSTSELTKEQWALRYIQAYGGIDGSHHKDWVLDQVVRILHGTPVITKTAKWGPSERHPEGLEEERFTTGEPTQAYHDWVAETRAGEDGPETYDYEEGIAP